MLKYVLNDTWVKRFLVSRLGLETGNPETLNLGETYLGDQRRLVSMGNG